MPDQGEELGARPDHDAGVHGARTELSDLEVVALSFLRDAVLVFERGRPLWASPSVTDLLGWRPDEVLALTAAELVHPDDLESVRGVQRVLDEGLPVSSRARLRCRDGSWAWVESHMRPVYDFDGTYRGRSVHSWSDIAATLAAEHALEEQAHRFRLLAEHASEVVVEGSADGIVEWISPSVTDALGWHPEDLIGGRVQELTHPEDLAAVAAVQARVAAGEVASADVRLRKPDGEYRRFDITVRPLVGEGGAVTGRVASLRDIQSEHDARADLAASERRMRTVTQFAGELIVELSPTGDCEWASPAAARVVGWPAEELVGQRGDALVHPDDRAALLETRAAAAAAGVPASTRVRFRTREGDYHWVDTTGNPIVVDGELTGFVSVIRNAEEAVAEVDSLRQREAHYEMLANNSANLSLSRNGMLVWVSPPTARALGYRPEDMVGQQGDDFIHADDLAGIPAARVRLDGGDPAKVRVRVRHRDESYHWYEISGRPVVDDAHPEVALTVSSWQLVDEEVDVLRRLEQRERQIQLAMSGSPEGMAIVDPVTFGFLQVNDALCHMLGRDDRWLLDHRVADVLTPDDRDLDAALRATLLAGAASSGPVERRLVTAGGDIVHVLHTVGLLRDDDGTPLFFVSHFSDISDRIRSEAQLAHAATHDPLTGLANRALLVGEIDRALRGSARTGAPVSLLLVDLDNFKFVNDSLGHAVGDALLRAAASRMSTTVREEDLLCRHGGDEFVVLIDALDDVNVAVNVARRIVEAFRQPLNAGGSAELTTTASVGIAVANHESTPDTLLAEADAAMYRAKAAGRDRISVFNDELRQAVDERLRIENDLRLALERNELELHYQPEVELATGRMNAVEALLRWHHPNGKLMVAGQFVEVAEDTGLMQTIGAWVVREACRQAAQWQATSDLVVRVNLSARQLAEPDLLELVDDALRTTGADPHRIAFEITETSIMRDLPVVDRNVHGLHERGFELAVDDFGTGYASLTYLSEFPIAVLKLDRSFVSRVVDDDFQRRLLAGVIALAESLGATTTAEGIEEPAQAHVLAALGCTHGQGWLWAKALPASEITALLDQELPFA